MWRIIAGVCAGALGACAAPTGGGDPATAIRNAPPQPAIASAAPTPAANLALKGTRWRGVISSMFDQSHAPRLEFVTAERLSGYTGCNMLSGSWREEGGEAHLAQLITTKRACVGPESEIERRLMAALSDKSRITREGAKLVVTSPEGRRFEFYEEK